MLKPLPNLLHMRRKTSVVPHLNNGQTLLLFDQLDQFIQFFGSDTEGFFQKEGALVCNGFLNQPSMGVMRRECHHCIDLFLIPKGGFIRCTGLESKSLCTMFCIDSGSRNEGMQFCMSGFGKGRQQQRFSKQSGTEDANTDFIFSRRTCFLLRKT